MHVAYPSPSSHQRRRQSLQGHEQHRPPPVVPEGRAQPSDIVAVRPSTRNLPHALCRKETKWHRKQNWNIWYCDYREVAFEAPEIPPDHVDVSDGHIYVQYAGKGGRVLRMWIRTSDNGETQWVRAYLGSKHPTVSGRLLIVNDRTEPSWVVPKTAKTYEWRDRKRARGSKVRLMWQFCKRVLKRRFCKQV
jgi:hypothetical protein